MSYFVTQVRPRRRFQITVGLRQGYEGQKYFSKLSVEALLKRWIHKQIEGKKPFFTGIVSEGVVVYGSGNGTCDEPIAVIAGDTRIEQNVGLSDQEVSELLNSFAVMVAEELDQVEIFIELNNDTWSIKRNANAT